MSPDIRKAAREAGVYAYSRLVASLLLLALPVVGAHVYPEKADLAFVLAVAMLHESAMAIGSLGLADSVFYFIGRDPDGARLMVRQSSLLLLIFAIPAIAGMMLAGWGLSGKGMNLVPSLPWLALVLLIELPTQPAVNQMIASGRARVASGLFVGFVVLRMIALLVPGVLGLGVRWVPVIMGLTGITRLIAHVAIVRGVFPLRAGEGRRAWVVKARFKEIILFALPAGAALVAGKINPQIDKYASKLLLGTHQFAEYGVAAFELPLVTLVPYAVAAVMQARYVRLYMGGDIEGLRALWFATVRKTALLVVPLAVLAIVVGHDLVIVAFGKQYADASIPFRILTLVLLHRIAAYSAILQAVNQPRAVMVSSIFLIVSNIVLTVPMTKLFGYPGPALASLLAVAPAFAYVLWRIAAVLGGGVRNALPWGFYGRVLLLSAAVGGAVWLGATYLLPAIPGLRLGVASGAFVVLFLIAGRVLGLVERGDTRYMREWLTLQMLKKDPADVEKQVTAPGGH